MNSDEDYQLTYLHVANGGNIWTGTKDKVIRYGKDFHFSANWHGVSYITKTVGTPYTFIEVEPGELIVGSSFGLAKLSNHNKTVTKYDLSPLGIQGYFGVTAIELDIAGNLLIGTDTGDLAV
ncbi:MAG: hypothetical protein IPG06_09405 [Haliea sp.]|nr:hypothetical protein [Haliea sp.]